MSASPSLATAFARALPEGTSVVFRHLRTAPASCPALFAPPPGCADEPTRCEKHLLLVSVPSPVRKIADEATGKGELLAFALEVFVYTTDSLTVVFVSKADTTGYLQRSYAPTGQKPSVRALSTAFLSHIIALSRVPGKRLIVSLFARAQSQYIFPGSATNGDKHILGDRALVKWWCRVVDPILREYEPETHSDKGASIVQQHAASPPRTKRERARASATAYLIVPGCDRFETRNLFPPTARADPPPERRWRNCYPLYQVCRDPAAPPRCVVPRFPDDPKARYVDELDREMRKAASPLRLQQQGGAAPAVAAAEWRSVKTLDEFWELMTFRQECSSGRLTGFLWMVVNPPGVANTASLAQTAPENAAVDDAAATVVRDGEFPLTALGYTKLVQYLEDRDFGDVDVSTVSTEEVVAKLAAIVGKRAKRRGGVRVVGSPKGDAVRPPEGAARVALQVSDLTGAGLIRKRKATTVLAAPAHTAFKR